MSEGNSVSPGAASGPTDGRPAGEETLQFATRPLPARFEVSQEPLLPGGEAEPPMGTYSPVPAYEHLGDLPPTYGSQSVYLVAYDPRQLFAYWDVDAGSTGTVSYGLRVCRGDGEVETEVTINPKEAGRYLVTGVPGGTYYVELGTTGRAGRWRPLGFSGRVTMPPGGLAGEVEPKFATLPFHLSFQRLLELIQNAMGQGEDLAAALARLQGGDRKGIESLLGTLASLSQEQMQALERLLGHQVNPRSDALSSFSGGSENSALAVSAGGSETLSSGAFGGGAGSSEAFGSETLTSGAGAFGSETLTLGAAGFGSETLASGAGAFGSETLTSGAAGFGSETLASGAAGFGSETLASGAAGFGSETLARGGLGFGSESLASGAAGFGSETLAVGGLGFGSESLSSFGFAASSAGILLGLGINSEAWRMASGAGGMSSESLASDRSTHFFRSIETNLTNLSSMFSTAAESLRSEFSSSEFGSGGGSGSF